MKYNSTFLASILTLIFSLLSCKSDDEASINSSVVDFDGSEYNLNVAYFTQYDFVSSPSTMDFIITDEMYPNPDKIDGSFYLQFQLFSTIGEFTPGTFTFDEALPSNEFTFSHAFIAINQGEEFDDNDPKYYALEGSTISISGEPYKFVINLDLKLNNGKTFIASYDGFYTDGQ